MSTIANTENRVIFLDNRVLFRDLGNQSVASSLFTVLRGKKEKLSNMK